MFETLFSDVYKHDFHFCTMLVIHSEENVWKLCDHVRLHNNPQLEHTYAVFISNSGRQVGY